VLINFTGGSDMTLHEVEEAAKLIQESSHEDANIIFGAVIDDAMEGEVRVTVIATGLDDGRVGRGRDLPVARGTDRASELGNVRPLRREASVEAREPLPALDAEPEIAPPPAATRRSEPVQEPLDGFSPFEDEYDEPAFLRRKKRDEADRDQPAFLRRSAD
jgi:cell division protein FtsZ